MRLRIFAAAAFALASCLPAPARAQDAAPAHLSLDDAFVRVARRHPDLRLLGAQTRLLLAEREQAGLAPPLVAGLELANAPGSAGLDRAELTLSLSGVLERGGKLDARRALAQTRIDALAVQREARRLDLLAETARRYLAIVAAQSATAIARDDIAQRQRSVAAARQRLQAGASPESVLLAARAALLRAELDLARATRQAEAARQHLAALWGERDPAFAIAGADLLALPDLGKLAALTGHLARTPELLRFVDEQRIAEARLRLARSARSADLDWQLGVRRLQDEGDTALVAGLSMPLGSARRAQPQIQAAEAELAILELSREAQDLALYATLVDAHGRYSVAREEAQRIGSGLLPALARAERAAERAYRAGATSYLEWAQLQAEGTALRRQQLEAALAARLALIELQRLTGQPLLDAAHQPDASP